MTQLIDGYNQIVSAIEDWMYVIQKEMETNFSPHLGLLYSNLSILLYAHQTAIPQVEELERIFKALGLEPRTVDTSSLDAIWGNDDPLVEGSCPP